MEEFSQNRKILSIRLYKDDIYIFDDQTSVSNLLMENSIRERLYATKLLKFWLGANLCLPLQHKKRKSS